MSFLNEALPYSLAFCRWAIAISFAWSFLGKARDVPAFVAAIGRFRLLPAWLHAPAAWAFLLGELAVVAAMLVGFSVLPWGFLLAALMLAGFSLALASVLARKISTSCNCFGSTEKLVSPYDLLRNAGLITCSAGGLIFSLAPTPWLGWLENGLMAVTALAFVLAWVQVGEIVTLFGSHPLR